VPASIAAPLRGGAVGGLVSILKIRLLLVPARRGGRSPSVISGRLRSQSTSGYTQERQEPAPISSTGPNAWGRAGVSRTGPRSGLWDRYSGRHGLHNGGRRGDVPLRRWGTAEEHGFR
jgi:hypothetical protein